jgi:WD40 repeat protein
LGACTIADARFLMTQKGNSYHEAFSLIGHQHYVASVASIYHNDSGILTASGSNDKYLLHLRSYFEGRFSCGLMQQHAQYLRVTLAQFALSVLHPHRTISCRRHGTSEQSDALLTNRTAMLWDVEKAKPVTSFTGHAEAVWAVRELQPGLVLTSEAASFRFFFDSEASADKTLRLWSQGSVVASFIGHTDCVRDAVFDGQSIFSVGNDGYSPLATSDAGSQLIQWTLDARKVCSLDAHPHFVYAAAYDGLSRIATSSEDKSFALFDTAATKAAITNPIVRIGANPVPAIPWDVEFLPDGDVVVFDPLFF